MMFVRKAEVSYVKNVEGAMIKTGLGGMAGNKGGIAVSFTLLVLLFASSLPTWLQVQITLTNATTISKPFPLVWYFLGDVALRLMTASSGLVILIIESICHMNMLRRKSKGKFGKAF